MQLCIHNCIHTSALEGGQVVGIMDNSAPRDLNSGGALHDHGDGGDGGDETAGGESVPPVRIPGGIKVRTEPIARGVELRR